MERLPTSMWLRPSKRSEEHCWMQMLTLRLLKNLPIELGKSPGPKSIDQSSARPADGKLVKDELTK